MRIRVSFKLAFVITYVLYTKGIQCAAHRRSGPIAQDAATISVQLQVSVTLSRHSPHKIRMNINLL
jgi:hypothetical protein